MYMEDVIKLMIAAVSNVMPADKAIGAEVRVSNIHYVCSFYVSNVMPADKAIGAEVCVYLCAYI